MDPAQPAPATAPPKTPGLAIASLVLGILGFFLLLLASIPAIITGHIALSRISKSKGTLSGTGIAIAGLVLGYLTSLSSLVIIAAMAIFFVSAQTGIDRPPSPTPSAQA